MNGGTFTMKGGEISGNTAASYSSYSSCGGGVYVVDGTFTMSDGEILNNATYCYSSSYSAYGGGVFVSYGTFIISGGEVSGNSSSSSTSAYGGGVFINRSVFKKNGGTIFGYTNSDINSNVVKINSVIQQNKGHAIYAHNIDNNYIKHKETISGWFDNLFYDAAVDPPVWSGDWDY